MLVSSITNSRCTSGRYLIVLGVSDDRALSEGSGMSSRGLEEALCRNHMDAVRES